YHHFRFGRDVAQPGSALAWGARGPEFKSRRPDQFEPYPLVLRDLFFHRHLVLAADVLIEETIELREHLDATRAA
ncbi:MAG: hypothetical protein RLY56_914, partial [Pseudomonadota bacterium]